MNYNYPPPYVRQIAKLTLSMLLVFTVTFNNGMLAQNGEPLFSMRTDLPSQVLSTENLRKLIQLETISSFKSITPISIGDLTSLQRNGEVVIQIPGKSNDVVFNTSDIISRVNGDFEWFAPFLTSHPRML
jgi:hypothetical protein